MKIFVFIILLILNLNAEGQTGCKSGGLCLKSIDKNNTEQEINLKQEAYPTNVSLFSQIELSGLNTISIVYSNNLKDSTKLYYSSNIGLLQNLAKKYSDSKIILDAKCESSIDPVEFAIIENKSIFHHYQYNKECKFLKTDCGIIKCDLDKLLKQCDKIQVDFKEEEFTSEQSINNRILELIESDNVIIHSNEGRFVKGILELEFLNMENKVNSILQDSFYLNVINKLYQDLYENEKSLNKKSTRINQVSKILQVLLGQEMGGGTRIVSFRKIENSNNYLIVAEYTTKRINLSNSNIKVKSNEYSYLLKYIMNK